METRAPFVIVGAFVLAARLNSAEAVAGSASRGQAPWTALADYRKDKAGVCPHALAALSAFSRGGAKRLLEGPAELARDNKCVIPAELAAPEEG